MTLKGIAIWILGFFSFLAGANAVNATIMWFELGPTGTFTPYLLGGLTGAVPVYAYLLTSALATLGFLGATSHKAVSEFSVADQLGVVNEKANRLQAGQASQQKVLEGMQAKVFLVDENVEHTRRDLSKGLSDQGETIERSMKADHQDQHKMLNGLQGQVFLLDESLKGIRKGLGDQTAAIEGINANLMDKVGPQLAEVKEALGQLEMRDISTRAAIAKQKDEIAEIKLKLERLENALIKPKPHARANKKRKKVTGYIEILSKTK